MDLNQLGRRNLSKEDRDELIRRLAAAGIPQRKIAATAKCSQGTVSNIANKMIKNDHSPTIKSTSANEELEAKQHEIERLRAEGWTQAEIGEAVGMSQRGVGKVIHRDFRTSSNEPTINSTSATEELEAKQQEIERLKAERDALAEKQRHFEDDRGSFLGATLQKWRLHKVVASAIPTSSGWTAHV